jgi:hypothetical protein
MPNKTNSVVNKNEKDNGFFKNFRNNYGINFSFEEKKLEINSHTRLPADICAEVLYFVYEKLGYIFHHVSFKFTSSSSGKLAIDKILFKEYLNFISSAHFL